MLDENGVVVATWNPVSKAAEHPKFVLEKATELFSAANSTTKVAEGTSANGNTATAEAVAEA